MGNCTALSSQYSEAPTFRGRVPNSSIQSGRLSFTASKVRPQPLQASMASRRSWPSRQVQRIKPAPARCSAWARLITGQFGSPISG